MDQRVLQRASSALPVQSAPRTRTPAFSRVTMSQVLQPAHASNPTTCSHDMSFTAQLLKWMDVCACMAAERHSGETCVTASVDELAFKERLVVGQLVVIQAQVNRTFNSSMEVGVRISAETMTAGSPTRRVQTHICSAYFTFVLNCAKEKLSLIQLVVENEVDKRRHHMAQERRRIRLSRKNFIQSAVVAELQPPLQQDFAVPVSLSASETTELILPPHANHMGNLFGGQAMAWMEQAALVSAMLFVRAPVRITEVDDIHFFAPAVVGDRLRILSRVNRVFGSSMEVGVRVECEKLCGGSTHLNSAYFTIERIDRGVIPDAISESEEEKNSAKGAIGRWKLRVERISIRSDEFVAYKWSKEMVDTFILDNLKTFMDLFVVEDVRWRTISSSYNITMSFTAIENGVAIKLHTEFACPPSRAYELVKDLKRRSEWDMLITGYRVLQKLNDGNDVAELDYRGTPPRTFTVLRSWRKHPAERTAGEVSSSGSVIQGLATAANEKPRCSVTYLLQLASGTVKFVGEELLGQSHVLVASFAKLRTLAETMKETSGGP